MNENSESEALKEAKINEAWAVAEFMYQAALEASRQPGLSQLLISDRQVATMTFALLSAWFARCAFTLDPTPGLAKLLADLHADFDHKISFDLHSRIMEVYTT